MRLLELLDLADRGDVSLGEHIDDRAHVLDDVIALGLALEHVAELVQDERLVRAHHDLPGGEIGQRHSSDLVFLVTH